MVENIVGKGEIACTGNFSFSHNVFKKLLSQTHQKVSSCMNRLNGKVTQFYETFIKIKVCFNELRIQISCIRSYVGWAPVFNTCKMHPYESQDKGITFVKVQ